MKVTIAVMKVETPPKAVVIPVIMAVSGVIKPLKLNDKVVNWVDIPLRLAIIWSTWACVGKSETELKAFNCSNTNWPNNRVWNTSHTLTDYDIVGYVKKYS